MILSKSIDDLFPTLKRAAIELTKRVKDAGYDMKIISTLRDFEYQNKLYAQGRTTPGPIITQARGGQSFHNYGLAFDVIQNVPGKEYDHNFLNVVGKIAMEMGLEWGGSWKGFVDKPHFQWSDKLSITDLQKNKMPTDKKLSWEQNLKVETPQTKPSPTEKPKEIVEIKPKESTVVIDGKDYTVNVVFMNNINYVELKSFEQAGYKVEYLAERRLPSISKPE